MREIAPSHEQYCRCNSPPLPRLAAKALLEADLSVLVDFVLARSLAISDPCLSLYWNCSSMRVTPHFYDCSCDNNFKCARTVSSVNALSGFPNQMSQRVARQA